MINKDLIQRFEEAFRYPEKINAEENAAKASDNAERLTLQLLVLAMLLILVIQGEIDKPNFFGIGEIRNQSIVPIALLLLVSYTQYDLLSTLLKFDCLSVIYKVIVKHRDRVFHEQRLSKYFLFPPTLYEYCYSSSDGMAGQTRSFLWSAEFLIITVFIPVGSEIIAVSKLRALVEPEYFSFVIIGLIMTFLLIYRVA